MKILMINSVCGIRSTGRICTDLADILTNQGHDVKIAYGREAVPEKYLKYAVKIGNDPDHYIHAGISRILDNSGFGSSNSTRNFLKWVSNYDPDIIHLHNLHGYYINVELLFDYLAKSNKPVIWTLHDCWAFTGHCAYFSNAGCEKWKTGCFACPQKKSYPTSYVLDAASQNWLKKKELFTSIKNMKLVTPSNWLASIVAQSFLNIYQIVPIYNGIDLSVFRPIKSNVRQMYNLENKKIILGVASAWGESKGLGKFCDLSRMLDSSYQVVLVGLSKKQMRTIPHQILGIIKTNSTLELSQLYSAADVFVNPSKQETMGLTTVEAIACGTPVVVSNYTAVPEVVNEKSGIILDDISIESIKQGIEKVLASKWDNVEEEALKFDKNKQYQEYIDKIYYGMKW